MALPKGFWMNSNASRLFLMRIPALEYLPGATVVGSRFTVSPIRSSIASWVRMSGSWSFGISTATQSTVENVGEAPLRRVAIYANLLAQTDVRFFGLTIAYDAAPTPHSNHSLCPAAAPSVPLAAAA